MVLKFPNTHIISAISWHSMLLQLAPWPSRATSWITRRRSAKHCGKASGLDGLVKNTLSLGIHTTVIIPDQLRNDSYQRLPLMSSCAPLVDRNLRGDLADCADSDYHGDVWAHGRKVWGGEVLGSWCQVSPQLRLQFTYYPWYNCHRAIHMQ